MPVNMPHLLTCVKGIIPPEFDEFCKLLHKYITDRGADFFELKDRRDLYERWLDLQPEAFRAAFDRHSGQLIAANIVLELSSAAFASYWKDDLDAIKIDHRSLEFGTNLFLVDATARAKPSKGSAIGFGLMLDHLNCRIDRNRRFAIVCSTDNEKLRKYLRSRIRLSERGTHIGRRGTFLFDTASVAKIQIESSRLLQKLMENSSIN